MRQSGAQTQGPNISFLLDSTTGFWKGNQELWGPK